MHKIISDYVDEVNAPIRSNSLRKAVRAELTAHLLESCADMTAKGLSDDEAARYAVSHMGSPYELGKRILQANHSRRDIIATVGGGILAVIGILGCIMSIGRIHYYIDPPSIVYGLVLATAFALLSVGRGFTVKKFLHQFKFGSLFGGVFLSIVGFIAMLADMSDISRLVSNIAVALLSIFYGILFAAIAHAAEKWRELPKPGTITALLRE